MSTSYFFIKLIIYILNFKLIFNINLNFVYILKIKYIGNYNNQLTNFNVLFIQLKQTFNIKRFPTYFAIVTSYLCFLRNCWYRFFNNNCHKFFKL